MPNPHMANQIDAEVAFAATGSEATDALLKFLWYRNNASDKPAGKIKSSRG